ncbi:MAG TPA: hypothetical protein VL485_31390 [Ktedonobacteraceae bacterium]|nr:hypothetical protein [Ktedonobacteraceae bacterium]
MKQKYFPLTFLGAGLLGALSAAIFCVIFLLLTDSPQPGSSSMFYGSYNSLPIFLCASVATAISSMFFWCIFILLPNNISVRRGVFTGLVSVTCAVPLMEGLMEFVHGGSMASGFGMGLFAMIAVGFISRGTIFLIAGVMGWLYVLLVRKVFALDVIPLLPPE